MTQKNDKVAIISYSYRLPGSADGKFWEHLLAGKDLITKVPEDRWPQDFFQHPDAKHPGTSYSFAAGTIGDISGFDASFFGVSPREAANMDPQQRLMLELTWEALENARISPATLRGSNTQVILGVSTADYANRLADDFGAIDSTTATGNAMSILANRLSYYYDFKGPSHIVDTACSSSLVAFHQACQAIRSGQTNLAVTGGINLHLHPYGFLIFAKANMLSPTGHCHVFDAAADGYVRSEGGGIFILKNYQQALADNDPIIAVVAGSGVNTDGNKSSMAVPCAKSQANLIRQTSETAGIQPDDFDYFEAHGTGTQVGDPVETQAIGSALGQQRKNPLPIGSIKSNLGHLEAAAGVASLVKALLTLENRCIPPSIGMKTPNPNIKFDEWQLDVVTAAKALPAAKKLTVGLNSFGFGGANANVILQNDDEQKPLTGAFCRPAEPLPLFLSARSPEALQQTARKLADLLKKNPQIPLYDLAYSTRYTRQQLKHSALLEVNSTSSAIEKLTTFASQQDSTPLPGVYTMERQTKPQGPVFVYSGNGCQWPLMGKELIENDPVFRQAVEEVDRYFMPLANFSLVAELAGGNGDNRLEKTEIAQPALFALQVGITKKFRSEGISAKAVTGHSVGEIAAAWASGALSLQSAVKVIYYRSLHQGFTKGQGQMTAVAMGQEGLRKILAEARFASLSLAGINSPRGCTVAGPESALEVFELLLEQREILHKRLPLDYAFHSPVMDRLETGIRQDLDKLTLRPCSIPFISTVTGKLLDGQQLNADYWWRNIREPVLFETAIEQLVADGMNLFIEIGGQPILQNYLKEVIRANDTEGSVIPTISRQESQPETLITTARKTLLAGADDNLDRWFSVSGNLVSLPNYPWQKDRYWINPTSGTQGLLQRYFHHPLLGYPLAQQHDCWENQLDTQKLPWLLDHQVGDSVVFPGAGFAEILFSAAASVDNNKVIEVENLEILSPLLLSEHSKVVRTELQREQGKITISSRSDENTWTSHVKARLVQKTTGQALSELQLVLPQREVDFKQQDHQEIMDRAGLHYGPAFDTVVAGWNETDQVTATLQRQKDSSQSAESFLLHPGLLDGAFQLCSQLLKNRTELDVGIAYVPVRIERIQLAGGHRIPRYTNVRLLARSPHSMVAELSLFDADKQPIALCQEVRLKEVRLQKSAQQALTYLDYHLTPVPREGQISRNLMVKKLKESLPPTITSWKNCSDSVEFNQEIEPLLESLAATYLTEALRPMASPSGLLSQTQTHIEQYHDLIATALRLGILQQEQDGLYLIPTEADEVTAELIWNTLIREYPGYLQQIHSVGRSGLNLKTRLSGDTPSPPGQRQPLYSRLVRDLQLKGTAQRLTQQLQAILKEQQEKLPEGERLKLLETGYEGPLFAELLSSEIDFRCCDYSIIAHSDSAIEAALSLQQQYPAFQVFPNEEQQNIPEQQLALVHLDFLCDKDFSACLEEIQQFLAPGAVVLLVGLHSSNWLDFALQPTANEHSGSPLSCRQVTQILEKQHLRVEVSLLEQSEKSTGCYLLLAEQQQNDIRSMGEELLPEQNNWLLICSENKQEKSLAESLAANLRETAQTTRVLAAASVADLEITLGNNDNNLNSYNRIIHINGLLSTATAEHAINRCEIASTLIRHFDTGDKPRALWSLTQGMAATYPSDQPQQEEPALADRMPEDAALWGFSRTAMNEAGNLEIRLIDLPQKLSSACRTALLDEWLAPGPETELCLTTGGARFAPRLRREQPPVPTNQADAKTPILRLGFQTPGQLRNLCWQTVPPLTPAEDELEIEVIATGLNFRDVMYTLGLLSDEALENGFSGPSLGLEFSGRIISTGSPQSEFSPGDLVVGFAAASFSNRLLAKADAVARLPEQLEPVAAATIPTAFFTAYYALCHCARLQAGEKVLIHGGAGGVGIAAIQIAQWLGAEVYATAGSAEKRDFLALLGVKHIYDSRSLVFAEEILVKTDGIDVILNSLAGEAIQSNFRILKPFGRFLEIGKRDFYADTEIGLRPFRNNISYFGIDVDQLQLQNPVLANRLFKELMQLFAAEELHPLPYTMYSANQVEKAFRHMQQSKQIGKVLVGNYSELQVETDEKKADNLLRLSLPENSCYLITGGTSGLGLRLAQWLGERGATDLVLCSRKGEISAADRPQLKALEELGVTVHARRCDVSNRSELELMLEFCRNELPPLKGIIHAATTIEDGLIRNQTDQLIRNGMTAKILGARHLHQLTAELNLDIFILLSSATTLFGNPGQSSYVAANLWLEGLAAHRRTLGLPATCIRLGAIDDVGFLADNQDIKENLQNRMGGNALHSDDVVLAIERMLLAETDASLGCLEFDWSALKRFLPTAAAMKFSEIDRETIDKSGEQEQQIDLQQMLQELSADELHDELLKILTAELSRILLIPENKIDPNSSLYDLGLDSLMGVELTAAVEETLAISLPVMLLAEAPSLNKLCNYIIKTLQDGEQSEEQAEIKQMQGIAAQHGLELSDDKLSEQELQQLSSELKSK